MMKMTPSLVELMVRFELAGFQIRIVGGAVRDHVLGIKPKDIDLCTDATPDQMKVLADRNQYGFVPTGVDHGTVTLIVNHELFEVTTLRQDVDTDGRRATVEFTTSFEDDAARRDLTINAMSMDLTGHVFDYFGGLADLDNKIVRFVGDANQRVAEDYLRILRYFRFAARGFTFDMNELTAVTDTVNLNGLKQVSVERYWMEMQKLVVSVDADRVLEMMHYTGVLNALGLSKPSMPVKGLDSVSALSTMLTPDTLPEFLAKWKLSSDEARKLMFLVNTLPIRGTDDVKLMLLDDVPADWVRMKVVLGRFNGTSLVDFVETWVVPAFPVNGQDLLDLGMKQGPDLGRVLTKLRNTWKQSVLDFKYMTREQLLEMVYE